MSVLAGLKKHTRNVTPLSLDRLAQDADRAAVVEQSRDVLDDACAGRAVTPEPGDELLPLLRLGVLDESEQLVWKEAELAVVAAGRERAPPVSEQVTSMLDSNADSVWTLIRGFLSRCGRSIDICASCYAAHPRLRRGRPR